MPTDSEPAATCGPWSPLTNAAWLGLLVGLLELVIIAAKANAGVYELIRRAPHFLWMVPTSNLVLFSLVGLMLAVVGRVWRRLNDWLAAYTLSSLACVVLLLTLALFNAVSCLILALELSSWTAPWWVKNAGRVERARRCIAPFLLGTWLLVLGYGAAREFDTAGSRAARVAFIRAE